jgi:hypothetical protein
MTHDTKISKPVCSATCPLPPCMIMANAAEQFSVCAHVKQQLGWQCTYNVAVWCVRVTTVAVERQQCVLRVFFSHRSLQTILKY